MPKKSKKLKKNRLSQQWQTLIILSLLLISIGIILLQIKTLQQTHSNALSNCTVPAADLVQDAEEQKLLQLVNTYRQQHNLKTLKLSTNLNQAAAWLSNDMAAKNYLSHTDSIGRLPMQRLADCGYNTFNIANGENIAGNTPDANSTFTQWKNSPVHNANMLQANFIVAGIARTYNAASTLKWYWTLDFGGQDDSNNTPSQAQPSQTPIATIMPPTPTSNFVCGGSTNSICLTPTVPTTKQITSIPQSTATPVPSSITTSEIPTISQTPISTAPIPTPKGNTNALIALLLSIITFIIELFRKLI